MPAARLFVLEDVRCVEVDQPAIEKEWVLAHGGNWSLSGEA